MSSQRKRSGGSDPGRRPPRDSEAASARAHLVTRRHQRFGWWGLLCFLALGLFLESLHGFKVGWYLDVPNATRRQMWTLAHAHGTLLSVVNLIFAASAHRVPGWKARHRNLASTSLLGAFMLLPAGFFLGGLFPHDGDPGLGIILVPLGGILLLVAVFLTARGWTA